MTESVAPAIELPVLGDALEFLRLFWAVDHAMQRSSKRIEAATGITGPQRLVIRIVGRFPGIPAGQIAKLLHVHPATLSGIVKRLERQGLIKRRSDPRDGRRALLGLTNEGRAFDGQAEASVEVAIQRTLETSAPEKVEATREVLESIARTLSNSRTHGNAESAALRSGCE
jgi:DNA-binding MarR family transcriptional regulator